MKIPHSAKVAPVQKDHWAPPTNSHSNAATCSLSNLEVKFVSMVETLVQRGHHSDHPRLVGDELVIVTWVMLTHKSH